jgi:hypothetical protein
LAIDNHYRSLPLPYRTEWRRELNAVGIASELYRDHRTKVNYEEVVRTD